MSATYRAGATPGPGSAIAVPARSAWGLGLLMLMLPGLAVVRRWR